MPPTEHRTKRPQNPLIMRTGVIVTVGHDGGCQRESSEGEKTDRHKGKSGPQPEPRGPRTGCGLRDLAGGGHEAFLRQSVGTDRLPSGVFGLDTGHLPDEPR